MSPLRRGATAAVILLVIALVGVACGSSSNDGAALKIDTPNGQADAHGIVPPKPLQVGATALPDASAATAGATFALAPPRGRLNLVFFGYTNCPDVCPGTMATVGRAFEDMGSKADTMALALVTVDPKRDTAERMRAWVEQFIPDGRGHGLRTDDSSVLEAAQRTLGVVASPSSPGDFSYINHTGALYAVAHGGKVVAMWPYGVDPKVLAGDIERLQRGESL